MKIIEVRNVNGAYKVAMAYLRAEGEREESRNGPVLVAPVPVATVYARPCERVLFSRIRRANPFFHFMEGLWMLAGCDDLAFVQQFVARMGQFSDDGKTLHGAYGKRWRSWFGFDQLAFLVDELRANPTTRRAVLQIWSVADDLRHKEGRDLPCNTHAYFDVRGGALNMTVCCRSNDAIWGCYGANVVHFSMLMEYMAAQVGVPVGVYRQISNNLHVYLDLPEVGAMLAAGDVENLYADGAVSLFPLVQDAARWDDDLSVFLQNPAVPFETLNRIFPDVAVPMYAAWQAHKAGDHVKALAHAQTIAATDWQKACVEWLKAFV